MSALLISSKVLEESSLVQYVTLLRAEFLVPSLFCQLRFYEKKCGLDTNSRKKRNVGLAIWISLKPWYCFSASCFHLHVDLWLPGDRCVRGKHLPGRPEVAPCQRLSGSGSVQGLHSGAHGISGRD